MKLRGKPRLDLRVAQALQRGDVPETRHEIGMRLAEFSPLEFQKLPRRVERVFEIAGLVITDDLVPQRP